MNIKERDELVQLACRINILRDRAIAMVVAAESLVKGVSAIKEDFRMLLNARQIPEKEVVKSTKSGRAVYASETTPTKNEVGNVDPKKDYPSKPNKKSFSIHEFIRHNHENPLNGPSAIFTIDTIISEAWVLGINYKRSSVASTCSALCKKGVLIKSTYVNMVDDSKNAKGFKFRK